MNAKNATVYLILAALGVIGFLTIAGIIYMNISSQTSSSSSTSLNSSTSSSSFTNTTTITTTQGSSMMNGRGCMCNDGTYSATANYFVEGHTESITVKMTISNGIVTSLTDTHSGNDRESRQYQNSFENQISSKVVGQNINNISLSRVGGASETTRGFNQALNQIKSEAAV